MRSARNRIRVEYDKVQASELPIAALAATWALMFPLYCFASGGLLWFGHGATNTSLVAQFGSLARSTTDTAEYTAITLITLTILPLLFYHRTREIIELCREEKLLAVLGFWIAASCLWSQLPIVTLEWIPVALVDILLAFYLYLRFTPDQQMRVFLLLGSICLLTSLLLAIFMPQLGIDHSDESGAWRGMYAQKNMCSMVTEFLLLPAFYLRPRGLVVRLFRLFYVVLSVFLILMTQSASGRLTLGILVAYLLVTYTASRFRRQERTFILLASAVIALSVGFVGLSATSQIARMLGKDPTFTGRTEIWQAVVPSIMKHPMLGYGYRAFWQGYQGESASISLAVRWAVPSAHNGLLEVWLTLGAVGVALVAVTLLRALRDAFACLRENGGREFGWYACIVFMTVVINVDEGELVNPYGLMWLFYILACVGLFRGAKALRMRASYG